MATVVIQKRKGKKGMSYAIRYRDPLTGKKKYYKTFKKQKEAQRAANELRAILDSGKAPEKKRTKLNPLTFSEVSNSLREEWGTRLERKDLSEKTFDDYCTWLNVLERGFGARMLCQISGDEILAYRDGETEKNSVISANRYLTIIKYVFAHGMEQKAIIENPAKKLKLLSEKRHERKRFLFPNEIDMLLKATQETRAKYYLPAIIYLGAEHGAAKQEILSLKWSAIDFHYKGVGLINLFRTKNGKDRTEFLMPRTKQALLEWRAHLNCKRDREKIAEVKSSFVFCRIDGTPIKSFKKAWWRVLHLAGIKDFHFHDLRHTFCSNLLLSGASLKDVKEMIGHQDISMTDRYSHLSVNHMLLKQTQLAEHYSSGSTS